MPRQVIAARDPATGRITAMPEGAMTILKASWRRSWGGPDRRRCERCGTIAMRNSAFCWRHDAGYLRNRTVIALRSGDPSRIYSALARLHRATMKMLWERDPWQAGCTIWFARPIEQRFAFACIQSGLRIEELPVWTVDRLRWGFRLSQVDRTDLAAWGRYVKAARGHAARLPPRLAGYAYQEPPAEAPGSPVVTVAAKPHPWDRRRQASLQPRQKQRGWLTQLVLPAVPSGFDAEAFLTAHRRDLREHMKALGAAADDPQIRRDLARCWAAILKGDSPLRSYQALARLLKTGKPLALTAQRQRTRGG